MTRRNGRRARDGRDADSDLSDAIVEDDNQPRDKLGRRRGRQTKRVDTIEAERRTEWVRKAIIDGFPTSDILAAVNSDPKWAGISRRQFFRYFKKAFDDVKASAKRDREFELGKAIERNETIIRRSLNPPKDAKGALIGEVDLRTAVRANHLNARLMGLEAPTRHAHGADPDLPSLPAGGDFIVLVQEVVEG